MSIFSTISSLFKRKPKAGVGDLYLGTTPGSWGDKVFIPNAKSQMHLLITGGLRSDAAILANSIALQSIAAGHGVLILCRERDNGLLGNINSAVKKQHKDFRFIDLVNPVNDELYDPLALGSAKTRALQLAEVSGKAEGPGAKYFQNELSVLLEPLISAMSLAGEPLTLGKLNQLFSKPSSFLKLAKDSNIDVSKPELYKQIESLISPDGIFKHKSLDVFYARLMQFMGGLRGHSNIFGLKSSIDLSELLKTKDVLALRIPDAAKPSISDALERIIAIDVVDAIYRLVRDKKLAEKTTIIAGYTPYIAKHLMDEKIIEAMSFSGVRVIIIVDTLDSWFSDPEKPWELIKSNAQTHLLFSQPDRDEARWCSQIPELQPGSLRNLTRGELYLHIRDEQGDYELIEVVRANV